MKKYFLTPLLFLLLTSLFLIKASPSFAQDYLPTDSFTASNGTDINTYNSAYSSNLSGTTTIQNNAARLMNPNSQDSGFTYTNSSLPASYCVEADITTSNNNADSYYGDNPWDWIRIDNGSYDFYYQIDSSNNRINVGALQDNPFGGLPNTYVSGLPNNNEPHHVKVCDLSGTLTEYYDSNLIQTISGQGNASGDVVKISTNIDSSDYVTVDNLHIYDGTSSPTPTPVPDTIAVSPSSSSVTVGTPFNATVVVSGDTAFNAAQANIAVSSNLSVVGIHAAPSPSCNLQYTQTPTTSNPSFAGAIFGTSSTNCNVYTLTLNPTSAGTGTITVTNGSVKAYSDNSEALSGVTNGSFTISAAGATPTPTPPLSQITFTSPTETYNSSYTLTGTKDTNITTVYVNGSSTGVTYPTSTTWEVPETLTLGTANTAGSNTFTVYGADADSNQTATVTDTVSLHTLGDINGDGVVDLTDASLFAVDWGKTDPTTFTYALSDMNGDSQVNLTDLSILAKLESQ